MNLSAPLTDKANAVESLNACEAVYNTCNIETDDAHIQVTEYENVIAVDFRGSKSPEDWINDLNFPKIITIYGCVHTGFWRSYISGASLLHQKLRSLPRKPLACRGHSLGGAQARIGALDLKTGGFDIVNVTTFGAPRPADAEFQENYNRVLYDVTIGYVNGRDIVPRMPFSDMGFVHVGQQGFLPSSGGLEVNPTLYELIHDDVVGAVADIRAGKLQLLDDHHLPRYLMRIGALP